MCVIPVLVETVLIGCKGWTQFVIVCVIPVLVETVLIGCKGWTQLLCVLYPCWLKLF